MDQQNVRTNTDALCMSKNTLKYMPQENLNGVAITTVLAQIAFTWSISIQHRYLTYIIEFYSLLVTCYK